MGMQTHYGRVATGQGQSEYFLVGANGAELLDAPPWFGGKTRGDRVDLESLPLLCPVSPSKIICIGKNYGAHAEEMGGNVPQEPLMFLKPPSSLVGSGGVVRLPRRSTRVDYEAELGVVIGRSVRNVSLLHAMEAVFGYVPLCDVTARDLQREDGQWTRAKGYDTFCPVGPMVHTGVDPGALAISLQQNGTLRQDANTQDMVHNVASLVSFASSVMTLEPGDLIATGTPAGVGPLADGDRIVIRIAGLTDLEFTVQAE
jgi:2-keto-4-pentenoate hydratase/2-oxohepta-3-ene-1,7-dioic acid hydratase in catechol pathway